MNEQELVIRLKQGSQEAFTALYKHYWAKVYHFSNLYLSSESEKEEVVQEVFVRLWEVRDFIKPEESFKGFLFIITRNIIFNNFRKSFRETTYKQTVLQAAFEEYDMEESIETADLRSYIKGLVSQLTPRQQEVFRLSREQHLSYREISKQLDISEKTVERHINDALRFLRKNIHLFLLFLSA
ncbi:MAG: RNA polymerase sigma-70 factor [Bacteroidia bacterium]|nr:RNA polymerase sigma-70 factor [Bacteroidia bacterium]